MATLTLYTAGLRFADIIYEVETGDLSPEKAVVMAEELVKEAEESGVKGFNPQTSLEAFEKIKRDYWPEYSTSYEESKGLYEESTGPEEE